MVDMARFVSGVERPPCDVHLGLVRNLAVGVPVDESIGEMPFCLEMARAIYELISCIRNLRQVAFVV